MARQNRAPPASPFFAPSTPRVLRPISTPGGTFVRLEKKEVDKETKATVFGTSGNLTNAIVGAGIVGIPYAMKESGLVAGVLMVILCAVLTVKSLRLLIETAKHINVPSYELLAEASFGQTGFYFISLNMFIMAYGAMVSYLMIIKDTIPSLLGISMENLAVRKAILVVSSFLIIFPLSCQRDMADLAKTSTVSVIFDFIMVMIVMTQAPIHENVYDFESASALIKSSTIHPKKFFIGLGVLSFAFVCQHSGFIIAGSLQNPTKKRWGKVTAYSLFFCGSLATIIGLAGYAGYGESTQGNILNNFTSRETSQAANAARGLLGSTMFFVYPMESFVARHVFIVVFFQGRRAHEGDDHAVLARADRRIGLTLFLYLAALIPAVIFEDLGSVLAVTGAVGGSSLSYIGPGAVYLSVHGEDFLKLIYQKWPNKGPEIDVINEVEQVAESESDGIAEVSVCTRIYKLITWYAFLMPLWCEICAKGNKQLKKFQENECLKSPHPNRLGKVKLQQRLKTHREASDDDDIEQQRLIRPPVRHDSFHGTLPVSDTNSSLQPKYGSTGSAGFTRKPMSNKEIARKIAERNRLKNFEEKKECDEKENELEDDPQKIPPNWSDFVIAVGYITLGLIAFIAGVASVYVGGS